MKAFPALPLLLVLLFAPSLSFAQQHEDEINIILAQRDSIVTANGVTHLAGKGSAYVGAMGTIGSGTNDYPMTITLAGVSSGCRAVISGNMPTVMGIALSGSGSYSGGPDAQTSAQAPLSITLDKIEVCELDEVPGRSGPGGMYQTPAELYGAPAAPVSVPVNETGDTGLESLLAAFMEHPFVLSLYAAAAAALLLVPILTAGAIVRDVKRRNRQRLPQKILSLICLLAAIGLVVMAYRGGGKADEMRLALAPALVAVAPFLWLGRLEKRHRVALVSLAGALIGFLLLIAPAGPLMAIGGIIAVISAVASFIALAMRPYAAQGRCDILSRLAVTAACLGVAGSFIVSGLWQVVATVTK